VYGKLSSYYDSKTPEAGQFLARHIRELSQHTGKSIMGYNGVENPQPWKVEDAPEKNIVLMQRDIVGIEIRTEKIQRKYKMSQEMRPGDCQDVVNGFARLGVETGQTMSKV
jgi:transcriptional regulator